LPLLAPGAATLPLLPASALWLPCAGERRAEPCRPEASRGPIKQDGVRKRIRAERQPQDFFPASSPPDTPRLGWASLSK
jgi:hypothetical protein